MAKMTPAELSKIAAELRAQPRPVETPEMKRTHMKRKRPVAQTTATGKGDCPNCGTPLTGRQKACSHKCTIALLRRKQRAAAERAAGEPSDEPAGV